MASYVVMEPPGPDRAARREQSVLVRDGFAWLAFLFPPLWLLWHRLWIEALLALAATLAIAACGEVLGQPAAGSLLALAVPLAVGLEGQGMRVAALRRRGWHERGVVVAGSAAEAETRFAAAIADEAGEDSDLPRMVPDAALARPVQPGLALGITHSPGRS